MNKNPFEESLKQAYDRAVDERDGHEVADWKVQERASFWSLLRSEGKSSLVDIGSGPGAHAQYFNDHGIKVTCIDLSPENIKRCVEKGLTGYAIDVMNLKSLGQLFDAAFAMNSLLHIPRNQLFSALSAINETLHPRGLFYWGQHGGVDQEGVYKEDHYKPKRFYSLLKDEDIIMEADRIFDIEKFNTVQLEPDGTFHFQSLLLRVRDRQQG